MIPELGSADQSIDAVSGITPSRPPTRKHSHTQTHTHKYEGWNFDSGNYLFTTDTK